VSTFSNTAADLANDQKKAFLTNNKNLVALLDASGSELFDLISAELALSQDAEDEVSFCGEGLDQKNLFARRVAREDFSREMYKQMCLAFLQLRQRGAVQFSLALTDEAQEELFQLEVDAGCRAPQQVVDAQAQQQSAAEALSAEVKNDWNGAANTSTIAQKKRSRPEYAARLEAMLNEGVI